MRRLRAIAEMAEGIAELHAPSGGGSIDPALILREAGVTLSYGHYGSGFDGMLEHRRGRFHVYCNLDRVERAGAPRARFTLAHEAGHYFIDAHRRALLSGRAPGHGSQADYATASPVEREADTFASHLLMPAPLFDAAVRGGRSVASLPTVLRVAGGLGTSLTSTAVRFAKADLAPCCVVRWGPAGYLWAFPSGSFAAAGHRTVVARPPLPAGSATASALWGLTAPTSGCFESVTTARQWFARVGNRVERDVLLREQAIQLGRFGALTLLTPYDEG